MDKNLEEELLIIGIASRSDTGYDSAWSRLSAEASEAARRAADEGASPLDILYSRLHEGYLALLRMESEGKAGTSEYGRLEAELKSNVNMYNLGLAEEEKKRKKERGSSQSLTVVARGIKSRFMQSQLPAPEKPKGSKMPFDTANP